MEVANPAAQDPASPAAGAPERAPAGEPDSAVTGEPDSSTAPAEAGPAARRIALIPVLADNYIFVLHNDRQAVVVDPAEADPVIHWLEQRGLTLTAVLQTHHHADHIGGTPGLLRHWPDARVHAAAADRQRIPFQDHGLVDGQTFRLLGRLVQVLAVPGHTSHHIAYYLPPLADDPDSRGELFCGDTLFAAGCGRLFEGSPAQMQASLGRLAALPGQTLVYCAHEYTLSNLRFARAAFPGDAAIRARLEEAEAARARAQPTVPSSIAIERATNPFLLADRDDCDAALTAAGQWPAGTVIDRATRFAALRAWKNVYR